MERRAPGGEEAAPEVRGDRGVRGHGAVRDLPAGAEAVPGSGGSVRGLSAAPRWLPARPSAAEDNGEGSRR